MHVRAAGIVKVSTIILRNLYAPFILLNGYLLMGDAGSDHGSKFILLSSASDLGSNARNQITAQPSIRQALSSTRCKEFLWWQIREYEGGLPES